MVLTVSILPSVLNYHWPSSVTYFNRLLHQKSTTRRTFQHQSWLSANQWWCWHTRSWPNFFNSLTVLTLKQKLFDINWKMFFSFHGQGIYSNKPIYMKCILFRCNNTSNNLFDIQSYANVLCNDITLLKLLI
jgi:hypothetical protein